MRASKFLSRWKQYYLCLNSQSQLSASASPFLQAAPAVALPVASARATLLRVTVDRAEVVSRIGAEGVEPSSCSSRCRRR